MDNSMSDFSVLHRLWNLLKLMSIESVIPSNHLVLCHPLLLLFQSFPASGSFLMSYLFALGDQSIGALASVLLMNIQGWFPLGLTVLIPLQPKGLSRIFSNTIVWKHQFFSVQPSLWFSFHIHAWILGKTIALTVQTFVRKVISLLFHMLSRFVITFLQGASVF